MDVANMVLELGKSLGPLERSGTGPQKESKVFSSIANPHVLPRRTKLREPASKNFLVSRAG